MKKIIVFFVSIILLSCTLVQAQKSPYVRWTNGTPAVSDQQIITWTKQALAGVAPTGALMTADVTDYINVLGKSVYDQALTGTLVVTTANGTETNWGIDPNGIPVKAGVLAKGTKIVSLPNGAPVVKWGSNGCLNATSDDQDDPDVIVQQPKPQSVYQQPQPIQTVYTQQPQPVQQPVYVNCNCPQQQVVQQPAQQQPVVVNCNTCPQQRVTQQTTYTVPVYQQPQPTQVVYTQPVAAQPITQGGCMQNQCFCGKCKKGFWQTGFGEITSSTIGTILGVGAWKIIDNNFGNRGNQRRVDQAPFNLLNSGVSQASLDFQ